MQSFFLHRQYCGPDLGYLGNSGRPGQTLTAAGQWAVSHCRIIAPRDLTHFPEARPHLVPVFG
jgi:hypothetical protein